MSAPAPVPPRPKRLRFHVWITPHDGDDTPAYQGEVEVRNQDQLVAENAARSLNIPRVKDSPFHLTNLWIWAACVRLGLTEDKFHVFTHRLDYDAVKDAPDQDGEEDQEEVDPT